MPSAVVCVCFGNALGEREECSQRSAKNSNAKVLGSCLHEVFVLLPRKLLRAKQREGFGTRPHDTRGRVETISISNPRAHRGSPHTLAMLLPNCAFSRLPFATLTRTLTARANTRRGLQKAASEGGSDDVALFHTYTHSTVYLYTGKIRNTSA